MNVSARDSAGDSAKSRPSPTSSADRAYPHVSAWLLFLIPAIVGIAGDLCLKYWSFPDGVPSDPRQMVIAGLHPGYDVRTDQPLAPLPIIPGILGFTTTVNQGAVFGIGQGKVAWFLAFSVLALGIIVWVFATSGARQRVVHLALGLILAGAVGNMYDRAVYHGVRDMLKFLCLHFRPVHLFGRVFPSGLVAADGTVDWYPYIFNVADVLLCIGVPLLIARWLFVKDEAPRA
jgi:signal peptidase II